MSRRRRIPAALGIGRARLGSPAKGRRVCRPWTINATGSFCCFAHEEEEVLVRTNTSIRWNQPAGKKRGSRGRVCTSATLAWSFQELGWLFALVSLAAAARFGDSCRHTARVHQHWRTVGERPTRGANIFPFYLTGPVARPAAFAPFPSL